MRASGSPPVARLVWTILESLAPVAQQIEPECRRSSAAEACARFARLLPCNQTDRLLVWVLPVSALDRAREACGQHRERAAVSAGNLRSWPASTCDTARTYIAMTETPYEAEKVLQELIEGHPEMLAGEDAAHGPLILVRREAGVSDREDAGARWSLDHLYLDAKGIPTLVEVKRGSDTRGRREVVAQMLDYAANARDVVQRGADGRVARRVGAGRGTRPRSPVRPSASRTSMSSGRRWTRI